MSSVFINDYVINRRAKLYFTSDDYDIVDEKWNEDGDEALVRLQRIDRFKGKLRWSDLTGADFRLLITKNIQAASYLAEEDRIDDTNPIVATLNFLICCLIRHLEIKIDGHVEMLRINRVSDLEVAIEFNAAMKMEAAITKKVSNDPFSVVVDNTSGE